MEIIFQNLEQLTILIFISMQKNYNVHPNTHFLKHVFRRLLMLYTVEASQAHLLLVFPMFAESMMCCLVQLDAVSWLYRWSLWEHLWVCTGCLHPSVFVTSRRPVGALDEAQWVHWMKHTLKHQWPLLWTMFIPRQASKTQACTMVLVFMLPF